MCNRVIDMEKADGEFEFLLLHDDAVAPVQGSGDAAAVDLFSPIVVQIPPKSTMQIPIGIAVKPPAGTYARTVSRSGLALHHQLFIPADCIDPDYRGGIHVCLCNLSDTPYLVSKHERIGSIVFEKYAVPRGRLVKSMDPTGRGSDGFGSTGYM